MAKTFKMCTNSDVDVNIFLQHILCDSMIQSTISFVCESPSWRCWVPKDVDLYSKKSFERCGSLVHTIFGDQLKDYMANKWSKGLLLPSVAPTFASTCIFILLDKDLGHNTF